MASVLPLELLRAPAKATAPAFGATTRGNVLVAFVAGRGPIAITAPGWTKVAEAMEGESTAQAWYRVSEGGRVDPHWMGDQALLAEFSNPLGQPVTLVQMAYLE